VREISWVAPDLAAAEPRCCYASALELARAELSARRAHLKLRAARWPLWACGLPLHRKSWSVREARVLCAFREAGIAAVEPRIAGARIAARGGEAFLATRLASGPDLERALVRGEAPSAWPQRVGAALAAVHGAGFVHRDAFLRNLVCDGPALVWIDAHRGGRVRCAPWIAPRGFTYDLACLDLDLLAIAGESERKLFWEAYLAAAPAAPAESRLRARVAASRARLLRRFSSRRAAAQAALAARLGLDLSDLLRRWGSR
jgi:tRNA A-37 threonylcarbamoyl transferase component Bud32